MPDTSAYECRGVTFHFLPSVHPIERCIPLGLFRPGPACFVSRSGCQGVVDPQLQDPEIDLNGIKGKIPVHEGLKKEIDRIKRCLGVRKEKTVEERRLRPWLGSKNTGSLKRSLERTG
jgi:hypothetical protein